MRRVPLSAEQMGNIQATFAERAIPNRCEVCGRAGAMALVPETAQVPMSFAPNVLGQGAIPSAVVVCNHCGNVRLHALGPLGLQALGNRPGP